MMESILSKAIESVEQSEISFCKFITANDTGSTGSHQSGYHIPKNAWRLFFDTEGIKGEKKDIFVNIKWQNDFEITSRFTYYGAKTRNEYRLTRFGRGFPYLEDSNIGDLLIISKVSNGYYEAFVLHSDEDIDDFLAALGISSSETNSIIPKHFQPSLEDILEQCFNTFIKTLKVDFPPTFDLAQNSRNCYLSSYKVNKSDIISNPDKQILNWLDSEFRLFKSIENNRYNERIKTPFKTVEELIECANTILNRRKSRAGKSLEHHLAEIFNLFDITYSAQPTTEDNKKPDFIFPNIEAYHDTSYNAEKLTMLAAKTTCKDRWRQVLNEANRVDIKHIFTLQQGISSNQLEEMYKYGVCLVVPSQYVSSFPSQYRGNILTLNDFINKVNKLSTPH